MHRELNRNQRDVLYADLLADLVHGFDDLAKYLRAGDAAEATPRRQQFEDETRLLDDLGWHPDEDRESYVLTMPEDGLQRVVQHISDRAEEQIAWLTTELRRPRDPSIPIADEEEVREGLRRAIDESLDVRSACLAVIDPPRVKAPGA